VNELVGVAALPTLAGEVLPKVHAPIRRLEIVVLAVVGVVDPSKPIR